MAADIVKLDLTDVNDYIEGAITNPFQLTTLEDSSSLVLASGRVEKAGNFYYQVTGGDLTVTDSGVAAGEVYILLLDDGDGTATAYLSTKNGEWDANLGGYYINDASGDDGAKVIFGAYKANSFYSGVYRMPNGEMTSVDVSGRISNDNLLFKGERSWQLTH